MRIKERIREGWQTKQRSESKNVERNYKIRGKVGEVGNRMRGKVEKGNQSERGGDGGGSGGYRLSGVFYL